MPITYPYTQYGGIWKLNAASAAQGAGTWPKVHLDPYYSSVSLLLPMSAGNNVTTFTDYSQYNTTITTNGGAKQSSTTYKFAPSSGAFLNNSDYLTLPNTNFNFGTGDLTIELWFFYDSTTASSYGGIFDSGSQGVYPMYASNTANLAFYAAAANNDTVGFAHGMVHGTWNFLAFVRSGTTLTIYVNGNSIGSNTGVTGTMSPGSGTTTAYVGEYSITQAYSPRTYMQDLRITKGVARYTSNFTPPTQPFPT